MARLFTPYGFRDIDLAGVSSPCAQTGSIWLLKDCAIARVADHLSVAELERRFRGCLDPVEARHVQVIWLLAQSHAVRATSEVTAFGARWPSRRSAIDTLARFAFVANEHMMVCLFSRDGSLAWITSRLRLKKDFKMIPAAVIGREHRANLRRLKAEFQLAYEAVKDLTDRTSAEFLEADRHYRTWIKAIDDVALALLDDIEGFEAAIEAGELVPSNVTRPVQRWVEAADISVIFCDIDDFEQTRELVGTSIDIPSGKKFEELG